MKLRGLHHVLSLPTHTMTGKVTALISPKPFLRAPLKRSKTILGRNAYNHSLPPQNALESLR